ncbi:hypothetical protein, partial [Phytohabitans suffuscus]
VVERQGGLGRSGWMRPKAGNTGGSADLARLTERKVPLCGVCIYLATGVGVPGGMTLVAARDDAIGGIG